MRASDERAQFVGVEAYEAAGGAILRDLFEQDDGGWLQDPALLEQLVADKLKREAEAIRAEGWKWVEVATNFPYGHTYGLRQTLRRAGADERRGGRHGRGACGRSMTSSSRRTRMPTSCPKRSISGLARSRRRWPRSTSGRSVRSRGDRACWRLRQHRSARAHCAWSAAMCGRRTSQPIPKSEPETDATDTALSTAAVEADECRRSVARRTEERTRRRRGLQADPRPADDRTHGVPDARLA